MQRRWGTGVGRGGAGAGKERVENQGEERAWMSRKRGRGTGRREAGDKREEPGEVGWGDKRKGLGGSHGMRNGRNRKMGTEIGGIS